MIKQLEEMPDGVIGLRASGEVNAQDYREVMAPILDQALERGGVRLLYVLDEDAKFSPGALLEDAKLGLGHLKGWDRMAVVSDAEWLQNTIKAFGWMMPGKVQLFAGEDIVQAKQWLTEPEPS